MFCYRSAIVPRLFRARSLFQVRMKEGVALMDTIDLMKMARQAREKAYCPYSQFAVGAVVLSKAGRVYSAANVENASYGLSMCAERLAIFKAIYAGERELEAICLYGGQAGYVYPCGACLQVMVEFAPQLKLIIAGPDNHFKEHRLQELLPYQFQLEVEGK